MFNAARTELDYEATGEWKEIYGAYQLEAVRLIRDGEKSQILQMLENPLSNNLQYGFNNLASALQSRFRLETISEATTAADHFLALADLP